MINVKNISKRYKDKQIFKDLSFSIGKGEMVAFIGQSGSGKTTLLNCIGQLEPLTSGEISINDKKITKKNRKEFFRDIAGFLFQNFALIENETIKENLSLVSKDTQKIKELLKEFGIKSSLNTKIYKLSGGEQQRIALIRTILKNPAIILADEPTASLDKKNGEVVMNTLKKLSSQGVTVLVVTHDQGFISYFDHVFELKSILDTIDSE